MPTSLSTHRLDRAILATVAYADLFDFPLERREVHRDLIGLAATAADTDAAIDLAVARGALGERDGYLVVPGNEGNAARRTSRRANAARLRPHALSWGRRIAALPFVRLVALSGSLAAENPEPDADIDYLIVTAPGRLWLVRALTILLVRVARVRGVRLCPNYLLTTRALTLAHHDLYTAHELLQIAPIADEGTYGQLLTLNAWADDWLPNRYRQALAARPPVARRGLLRRLGEAVLGGALGDRLETWEAARKQRRFGAGDHGARFTADVCEGHYGRARERVLREFDLRRARIEGSVRVPAAAGGSALGGIMPSPCPDPPNYPPPTGLVADD